MGAKKIGENQQQGAADLDGEVEEGVDEIVGEEVGLQAQVDQLGALGVVVVLLCLHARVGHVLHLPLTQTPFSIPPLSRLNPIFYLVPSWRASLS